MVAFQLGLQSCSSSFLEGFLQVLWFTPIFKNLLVGGQATLNCPLMWQCVYMMPCNGSVFYPWCIPTQWCRDSLRIQVDKTYWKQSLKNACCSPMKWNRVTDSPATSRLFHQWRNLELCNVVRSSMRVCVTLIWHQAIYRSLMDCALTIIWKRSQLFFLKSLDKIAAPPFLAPVLSSSLSPRRRPPSTPGGAQRGVL